MPFLPGKNLRSVYGYCKTRLGRRVKYFCLFCWL